MTLTFEHDLQFQGEQHTKGHFFQKLRSTQTLT